MWHSNSVSAQEQVASSREDRREKMFQTAMKGFVNPTYRMFGTCVNWMMGEDGEAFMDDQPAIKQWLTNGLPVHLTSSDHDALQPLIPPHIDAAFPTGSGEAERREPQIDLPRPIYGQDLRSSHFESVNFIKLTGTKTIKNMVIKVIK